MIRTEVSHYRLYRYSGVLYYFLPNLPVSNIMNATPDIYGIRCGSDCRMIVLLQIIPLDTDVRQTSSVES